ncbi:MAG: Asp-tRNA(Asn)/Glu-tRNA(Gln) amidotransferase subunit GatC [Gammaproteobacteria bacterium]|nr:Asp-tRNA(Asn)/Glu-tRNA(Gln) amidotransferase subunit GatC [Gammaproteobacteria bacterium]
MPLTPKTVGHIARLSRLEIDAQKTVFHAAQLNHIMQLVDQMNRIDTTGIEPMSHPQEAALRMRDDEVCAENCRQQYQSVAPATQDGLYLVPKVIE